MYNEIKIHFCQQLKITQSLLYELLKVEQEATYLIKWKQIKTNKGMQM